MMQQWYLDEEIKIIQQLHKIYSEALKDINRNIKKQMERFDPETGDLPQSAIYRIKYQQMLRGQIEDVLNNLQTSQYLLMSDYLDGCYEDGFVGSFFDMHGQGVPLMMPIDRNAMVQAVTLDSKISKGLYTRLGEDITELKKKITSEVSRSILTGTSYAETARQLAGITRIGYNNAIRITRTEGHRIQVTATMDAMEAAKEQGADVVKQWDSTLDGRTRPSHRRVDGEIRELDESFSNGLKFPGDADGRAAEVINCRCALLERARWAIDGGFTKRNNFTGELETFDTPDDYAKFKKDFFSNENVKYMNYVQQMQNKYGTSNFYEVLERMTDREYKHYSKLLNENPIYKAQIKAEPTFTLAKTIKEAEEFARQNGVKYADYSKLPIDTANEINKALRTLPDDIRPVFVGDSSTLEKYWGGKLPRSSKQYYGVTIDTFDGIHLGVGNGIDFDTNGQMVGISYSYRTADKITAAKEAAQSRYQAKHDGHTWFFNVSGETTPFHEMGHVYANARGIPDGFEYAAMKWANESKCDMISKPSEAWAEAWASYHTGVNIDKVPEYVLEYIEKVVGK